jgi:hypothetical protein
VLREDRISPALENNEDLLLSGRMSKEAIDFLTVQIREVVYRTRFRGHKVRLIVQPLAEMALP